jgi:hypothetical protein
VESSENAELHLDGLNQLLEDGLEQGSGVSAKRTHQNKVC